MRGKAVVMSALGVDEAYGEATLAALEELLGGRGYVVNLRTRKAARDKQLDLGARVYAGDD